MNEEIILFLRKKGWGNADETNFFSIIKGIVSEYELMESKLNQISKTLNQKSLIEIINVGTGKIEEENNG